MSDIERLVQAHIAGEERLRRAAGNAVARAWQELPHHDRPNVSEFLARVLPIVSGAQAQSVAITNGYLAMAMDRAPLDLPEDQLTGAAVRNGAAPATVYERPFIELWAALKQGTDWVIAAEAAQARAVSAASTDVQLSMRATADAVGELDTGIYGYERVTDGNACLLCQIASTQRYHRANLMPIHNHCGCSVAPLTEPVGDSGIIRTKQDLYKSDAVYHGINEITSQRSAARFRARAEGNRAQAESWRQQAAAESDPDRRERLALRAEHYDARAADQEAAAAQAGEERKIRLGAREHGELGPVLVNADDNFTAPSDLH